MAKLKEGFPGLAALEEAGEATEAKVRKRIADGTLREIPGIGEATEAEIIAAFEAQDSPDAQARDLQEAEGTDHAETTDDANKADGSGETLLATGPTDEAEIKAKSDAEQRKSGAQKNREMENHALDQPTTTVAAENAAAATEGQRLANSGVIFVDDPAGAYVQKGGKKFPQDNGRVKVLPLAHVAPLNGMEVRDGDDIYTLHGSYERDSRPIDWLRVRSPNTGKPLVD